MNAFEAGRRKMIPAVLIYARHDDDVLMIHRITRGSADFHDGKWNGLGGKSDPDESAAETAAREFSEEAGVALPPSRFAAKGILHFPNFKPARAEDWLVHVFDVTLSNVEKARVPSLCPEGELHWIPRHQLLDRNLWEGDRHFLGWILDGKPFTGTFWYVDGRLARHTLTPLG